MKRMLVLTLVLALVLSLALPAAAFAKRGGVPAKGNGKAAVQAAAEEAPATEEAPDALAAPEGKDKDKKKDKRQDAAEAEEPEGTEPEDTDDAPAIEEPTEKLTGVENALSRLQRNLARMQADVDAGTRDALPAGLQSAIAKFMMWLGIDPAAEAENTDEGSNETSGTVEPGPTDDADDTVVDPETAPEAPAIE